MDKKKARTPTIADYAAFGVRLGAMILGVAATIALACHIVAIYRAGTGNIGWELTAPASYACALYLGWAFGVEHDRQRRAKARRKRREEAEKRARSAADIAAFAGSESGNATNRRAYQAARRYADSFRRSGASSGQGLETSSPRAYRPGGKG